MRQVSFASLLALAAALPAQVYADTHKTEIVTSEHSFVLEKVAGGLEHPWGLDWLPDGRIIVTERPGRLRIVGKDGSLSDPLSGLPEIVSEFRDGLLDVAVSPSFAEDNLIYFAYAKKDGDQRWLEVVAARLHDGQIDVDATIFAADVKVEKDQGFGSRIRFDATGNLMITVGDHAASANAQNPANTLGSVVRIKPDGTPLADNPGGNLHPAIYAWGFKNPQGLAIAENGNIWAVDHGGAGGGELNKVEKGANYGWPNRSFGGADAPGAGTPSDFVEPVFTWGVAPTVALSGLEIYSGAAFPNWQGDLFAGSLVQEALIRIMMGKSGNVIGTEYVLEGDLGRVRDVRQGPDGFLYVLNDDPEGGIYRLKPN